MRKTLLLPASGVGRRRLTRGVKSRHDIARIRRGIAIGILSDVGSHFGDHCFLLVGDPVNPETLFVLARVLPGDRQALRAAAHQQEKHDRC